MTARLNRIADQIQKELAEIIRMDLRDPRVKLVTLTGVEVTNDLAHAKVFYSLIGDAADREATAAGLHRSAGFLRSQIASRLTIKTVPQLHFHFDESLTRGSELSALIDLANATRAQED